MPQQIAQCAAGHQAVGSRSTARRFCSNGGVLNGNAPAHRVARLARWTARARAFVQQPRSSVLGHYFQRSSPQTTASHSSTATGSGSALHAQYRPTRTVHQERPLPKSQAVECAEQRLGRHMLVISRTAKRPSTHTRRLPCCHADGHADSRANGPIARANGAAKCTPSGHQHPYMRPPCATAKKPSTRRDKLQCCRADSCGGGRLNAPTTRSSDSRTVQLTVLLVPMSVLICLLVDCAQTSSTARSSACDVQTECSDACHCYPRSHANTKEWPAPGPTRRTIRSRRSASEGPPEGPARR